MSDTTIQSQSQDTPDKTTGEFKYDAFISYRHADLDVFVAEHLHKLLENFKVPKLADRELQKKQKKKINRVFRDKDELPASDNLAEPIEEALKDSQFLIVVCSPRTPESKWVSKEIELFAKYRGREHILAVLIEGEPYEAFPKVLCHGERKIILEDGTVQTESFEIEPLAADIRGASRGEIYKNLKKEVLRLAAPILHCSYDDLKQRHKEQKLKRIISISTVIAAVLLIFGCYAATQNLRIRRLQSVALAEQAAQVYSEGDRGRGLALAKEALSIRYTPEAQAELTDILQVYNNGETFCPTALAKHDTKVVDMAVNGDCSLILSADQLGQIYLWDGVTGQLLYQEDSPIGEVMPNTIRFIDQGTVVYGGVNGLVLFNTADMSSKILEDTMNVNALSLSNNQKFLLTTNGSDLYLYDTTTWDQFYYTPADPADELAVMGALNVSDDGSLISYGMLDAETRSEYVVMNTKKNQIVYKSKLPFDWVEFARMEQDGSSYVLSKDSTSTGSFMKSSDEQLIHYDATGKKVWAYQGIMLMRQPIEQYQDNIVIASNSDLIIIDQKTGKERTRLGFSSTIKKLVTAENWMECYLQDGTAFVITGQDEYYTTSQFLESAVRNAAKYAQSSDSVMIMSESDIQIVLYRNHLTSNIQQYEPLPSHVSGVILNEDRKRMLAYCYASDELLLYTIGDEIGQTVHIPYEGNDGISGIYTTADQENFVMVTYQYIRVYSWEDGTLLSENSTPEMIDFHAVSGDGAMLCVQTFDALYTMPLTADSTWELKEIALPEQLFYQFYLNHDGTKVIGRASEMCGECYDLNSGETTMCSWNSKQLAYSGAAQKYLVMNDTSGRIELYNEQNELLSSMEKKSSMIQNIGFSKDGNYIFIQNLDATLEIYQASNMTLKKVLSDIDSPIGRMEAFGNGNWVFYCNEIYGGMGYICNRNFEIVSRVPKLFAVNSSGTILYTANKERPLSSEIFTVRDLMKIQ